MLHGSGVYISIVLITVKVLDWESSPKPVSIVLAFAFIALSIIFVALMPVPCIVGHRFIGSSYIVHKAYLSRAIVPVEIMVGAICIGMVLKHLVDCDVC